MKLIDGTRLTKDAKQAQSVVTVGDVDKEKVEKVEINRTREAKSPRNVLESMIDNFLNLDRLDARRLFDHILIVYPSPMYNCTLYFLSLDLGASSSMAYIATCIKSVSSNGSRGISHED